MRPGPRPGMIHGSRAAHGRRPETTEDAMETTVTGLFPDAEVAAKAQRELVREGFTAAEISLITRDSEDLHSLLGEETSDATRGAIIGGVVGAVCSACAGAVLALPPVQLFEVGWPFAALAGAFVGGVVAGAIGFLVGSATGHQVQEEYEHRIERGDQLIAINTDHQHATKALDMLQTFGGQLLSTAVHGRLHRRATA